MADNASCKMGRDPKDWSTCFSWLFFRSYIWTRSFQGRAFLLLGKQDVGIVKIKIKHKWSRWIQVRVWTLCRVTWHMLRSHVVLQVSSTVGLCNLVSLDGDSDSAVAWNPGVFCCCLRHLHFGYESRSESLP